MRPHETQLQASHEEGQHAKQCAEAQGKRVAERGSPHSHVTEVDERELHHSAQHRHEQVEVEAAADTPADAKEVVDGEHERAHRRTEGVDAQEDDGVLGQLSRGA